MLNRRKSFADVAPCLPRRHGLIVAFSAIAIGKTGRGEAGSIRYRAGTISKTQSGFLALFSPAIDTLTEVDMTVTGGIGMMVSNLFGRLP